MGGHAGQRGVRRRRDVAIADIASDGVVLDQAREESQTSGVVARSAPACSGCNHVTMSVESDYITLMDRGSLALPSDLCRRQGLDRLRARVRVVERSDGVIELHPVDETAEPDVLEQTRFWTQRWQQMERESVADMAVGRFAVNDRVEELLDALEASVAD